MSFTEQTVATTVWGQRRDGDFPSQTRWTGADSHQAFWNLGETVWDGVATSSWAEQAYVSPTWVEQ